MGKLNDRKYYNFLAKKVKSRAYLTANGSEPLWSEYQKFYNTTGRHGSNCYSFAMNDFRAEGVRPNKAVPGDISTFVSRLDHNSVRSGVKRDIQKFKEQLSAKPFKYTNWRSCEEPIYRLLTDGKAAVILHKLMGVNLNTKTTIKRVKNSVSKGLHTVVEPSWRKVMMVVDSIGGNGFSTTDFHFFSQHLLPVSELYNVKLETMLKSGRDVDHNRNIYVAAGINAFTSRNNIVQRFLPNLKSSDLVNRVKNELLAPGARARTNLMIHMERVPHYALLFIPRPFWILNISRFERDVKQKLLNAKKALEEQFMGNDKALLVIDMAYKQCVDIVNGKKGRELSLSYYLGTFSEKAGWASQAMNSDGLGKLILDPELAHRNHGGFDYDKPCVVVKVLDKYGITSVPPELVHLQK